MSIRLAAEHCTLAPNVKAGDVKRIYFFYRMRHWSKTANAAVAFSQYLFAAGNKNEMCRIAARKSGKFCSVLRTPNRSRAVAQPCRSRYQRQPQLRYNIHAGPRQATTTGAMG
jgi:hypothetical protein